MPLRLRSCLLFSTPLLLTLGPIAAGAGGASSAPPPPDVAAFADAERAFARDAAARGITSAFIAALAPHSILFRPAPVDGQAWLADHPGNPEARLAWEPCYVEVSVGGDLGWTTGPWDFRRTAADEPIAFGHYSTVWRRQGDGTLGAAWAQTALAWSDPAGYAAEAGDVGYTYGTVTPPLGERQAFLHVWRNPDGKRWRLALDVMTPAPEPAGLPAAAPE